MSLPSKPHLSGALVTDANLLIALVAQEASATRIKIVLQHYAQQGYEMFAPGVIVSEGLYVLCGKLQDGFLSASDHALAIREFDQLMQDVNPPPNGDRDLVL